MLSSAGAATARDLPPVAVLQASPWNGDWVLSRTCNTAEIMDAAAPAYRFRIEPDGRIRWEIPPLGEVVEGHLDGRPMPIHRPHPTASTLAVSAEGPWVLVYHVSRNGRPAVDGRMTLVDLSQPAGRPDLAGEVVYVRPDSANR